MRSGRLFGRLVLRPTQGGTGPAEQESASVVGVAVVGRLIKEEHEAALRRRKSGNKIMIKSERIV